MKKIQSVHLFALVIGCFLGGLCVSPAAAAPSGAAFLNIDPSPRSSALGGGNPAVSLGAQAIHSNPAGLGRIEKRYEFFSAYSSLMDGVQYGYGSLAINRSIAKRTRIEGLGFSFTNLRVGGLEGRDANGGKSGSFGAQDSSYAASLSYRLSGTVGLGFTAKMLQSDIAGFSSNRAFGSDFGLRYAPKLGRYPLILGMTLANFGEGVKFINQGDPLPTALNVGASLGMGSLTGLLGVSRLVNDGATSMSLGFEFAMGPMSMRAGYRSMGGSAGSGARSLGAGSIPENFTSGMGFRLGSFMIDYAVSQPVEQFGMSHRIGLTLQWGATAAQVEAAKIDPYTKWINDRAKSMQQKSYQMGSDRNAK